MTSRTGSAQRISGILKKSVEWSWDLPREKTVDFRLLAEAFGRCRTRWGGGRWKSQNRKNVYLSPYVDEPLNSKVIKSFVPELRSRKCLSCFEIPMFYVYIYEHYMSISHIRIWLWYRGPDVARRWGLPTSDLKHRKNFSIQLLNFSV